MSALVLLDQGLIAGEPLYDIEKEDNGEERLSNSGTNEFNSPESPRDTYLEEKKEDDKSEIPLNHQVRKYKCEMCGIRCLTLLRMKLHKANIHQVEKPEGPTFSCNLCHHSFTSKKYLQRHRSSFHKGYSQCNICHKYLVSTSVLNMHRKSHFVAKKEFKCSFCSKRFCSENARNYHLRTHNCEKPYKCKDCMKAFFRKFALHRHMATHNVSHYCEKCVETFDTYKTYCKHIQEHHETVKRFPCDLCGRTYAKNHWLRNHLSLHVKRPQNTCQTCGKVFSSQNILKEHQNLQHTHSCDICEKTFTLQRHLKKHISSHAKSKPAFPCSICKKDLSGYATLMKHEETEHLELNKQYPCTQCSKVLKTYRTFTKHLQNHIAPDIFFPFPCKLCHRKYKREDRFNKHMEDFHGSYQCEICLKKYNNKSYFQSHVEVGKEF